MKKKKKKNKNRKKRTPEQQRKLREKRRRYRLNKKNGGGLIEPLSLIDNKPEIDYTKWYNVGKELISKNYHGLISEMMSSFNIKGQYEEKDRQFYIFTKEGEKWIDIMKQYLSLVTNSFFYGKQVMVCENDKLNLIDQPNLFNQHKDEKVLSQVWDISSQLTKMSKRKQKVILDGLLKQHLNLRNLVDELNELGKTGGVKDFRTQQIDIEKTNIFSCFDDFTYGLLEWLYEEKELIMECITPVLFSSMVRMCYMRLGNPNNRIEIENNTLEKLLRFIENDDYLLYFFRLESYGNRNEEGTKNYKRSESILRSWINNNPSLKEWFDDDVINESLFGRKHNIYGQSNYLYPQRLEFEGNPSSSLLYDIKEEGVVTPETDVTWIKDLEDDDMITIYRSVSDKNYPIGWSWTFDKSLSLTWIRSRGLVNDLKKTKSYIVETQIPKKDIMVIHTHHSDDDKGVDNYNEIIITKEKLKDCDFTITEIDGNNTKEIYNLIMSDEKIKESILHTELSHMIKISKEMIINHLPDYYREHINEKWFIKKSFYNHSEYLTQSSLGNTFNSFTERWESDKQMELVG